jgi:segregation and condensation protein A
MTERSVPWWRKAFTVALSGIRSGFGLFQRNGKAAAGAEVTQQAEATIARREAERDATQAQKEESQVKPSSAHSETTAAEEPTAANRVPEALPTTEPEIPSASASIGEPAAPTPAAAGETTQPTQAASAEEMTELLEIAAPPAPREATAPDLEPPPVTEPPTVPDPPMPDPPEPPPLPVPDPLPAPPVTEPPEPAGPDPLLASSPIDAAPVLPFPEKPQRTTQEKVAAALKAREARGEDAERSPFSVIVNQVYDGPLDLLLDLIRKQDIDIYDIPIAKITAQFLAYVDQLRSSDVDVAGDFIYTAALLIHIKSKMLLPRAPAGPDGDAEDPRRELVDRLLEHQRFKNAAQMLHEKQMLEAASWTNPGIREFQDDASAEPEIAADTTDLVRVFSGIIERARNRPILSVEEDSVTVGQMIQFMARRLTMEDKPVALRRLLSHTKSERALISMFLALLELVRLQAILLRQDRQFSEIFIKKHTGFEALMNQGLTSARDDWR